MNRFVFLLLFCFMVGLSGCVKDSDYVYYRKDYPVLLQYAYDLERYYFWSSIDGYCLVSDIPDEYIHNDVLWIDYTIDMKHQEYSNMFSATKVVIHGRIESNCITEVYGEDFKDDYTTPIDGFFIQPVIINTTMYFGFKHKVPSEQTFDYELVYHPFDSTPILYIKGRKTNEVTGPETEVKTMYGFDMEPFLYRYKNNEKTVSFYIKYLSAIKDGEEVYDYYSNEMLSWILSSD